MPEKRGLFIVFEGIDGSGKTSQIDYLAQAIRAANKYQDVLMTREPTWRAEELRRQLDTNRDPFSEGEKMAELFVKDRRLHTYGQIIPALGQREIVICDRYALSTCAYQSAQGVTLDNLLGLHEAAATLRPDMTFFIQVPQEVAETRMVSRGQPKEKFEGNREFTQKLIGQYLQIQRETATQGRANQVLGDIYIIDGAKERQDVADAVKAVALPIYQGWLKS